MTQQKAIQEIKKQIGNFKAVFKSSFDATKEDYIFLEITVSKELQELLKFSCSEINKNKIELDEFRGLKRYRVKEWIYNNLPSDRREILFIDSLVDDGKVKIPFNSLRTLENCISYLRDDLQKIIREVIRSKNISMTVNFNISKEDED
jgi:hypothetical protein